MTRHYLAAVALLAATAILPRPVAAQTTARPGVDCSLLTTTQAQGLPCATPVRVDTPVLSAPMRIDGGPLTALNGFVPSAETCTPRPNPYADPVKAAACSSWDYAQRQRPTLPAYEVGASYAHPYQQIQMIVLGIGSSLEGVPVVTAQFTGGTDLVGNVFAFKVNEGQPWTRLQP